jgi:predicted nucleic acid-binding protein
MGKKYLLDSNVIIGYLDNKLPLDTMLFVSNIVDNIPNISVISQIEVLRYDAPAHAMKVLTDFVNSSIVLPLDDKVVQRTINLCRQSKIKLPDAIIGATALEHNLILLTRNSSDFKNIEGLSYLNPWEIK